MRKFRVLDLFAGSQSVKKALDLCDFEYEYKGLDIVGENNEWVDLSDLQTVKEGLAKNNFKPDFIGASPPCRTFSHTLACQNGNFYYEKKPVGHVMHITPRTKNISLKAKNKGLFIAMGMDKKSDTGVQQQGEQGINMAQTTQFIINHFTGVSFCVENPSSSLIKWLFTKGPRVTTPYCMWGFDYRKNTNLWFGITELMKPDHWHNHLHFTCTHKSHKRALGTLRRYKGNKNQENSPTKVNRYQEKASVPPQLIKFILENEHKRW